MKADEEKAVAKAKAIQEEYDFAMDVPGDDPKVTALHCVKYWDILSTKHYVFNLLWPALKKLDWTEEVSTSRNLMLGSVFVPSWAQDRFERAGKDPESWGTSCGPKRNVIVSERVSSNMSPVNGSVM